ncbi:MAG: futalosine hydrolase [Desulfobacteraceae bacterium]
MILILSATKTEAADLLTRAAVIKKAKSSAGRSTYLCTHGNRTFKLIITGPGSINCAQALAGELEHNRFNLVLQTGTAGIFKETGLRLGDIGIAESETYIHTGVETPFSSFKHAPLPFDLIPENRASRTGFFYFKKTLVEKAFDILTDYFSDTACKITRGPFITVSVITATKKSAKALYAVFSPCMEAMEGSAAAQVAALYNTDFLEIRAGSNPVGTRDKTRWDIPFASRRACRAAAAVIERF